MLAFYFIVWKFGNTQEKYVYTNVTRYRINIIVTSLILYVHYG